MVSILICLLLACCGNNQNSQETNTLIPNQQWPDVLSAEEVEDTLKTDTIPVYARRIIDAYPDFRIRYSDNRLIFQDSSAILCDDGKEKTFTGILDSCDVEDMFSMDYDTVSTIPSYLSDCGRARCEELFKKMYGSKDSEARKNLVIVEWFGRKLLFSKVNGAAGQLEKVAAELAERPHLKKYLTNSTSYYWRKVSGAKRQSTHSYGIAIDINVSYSDYWLWSNPKAKESDQIKYRNRIPMEIVRIFERHGFIWGGRWYHYDTMHFEYRPELVLQF